MHGILRFCHLLQKDKVTPVPENTSGIGDLFVGRNHNGMQAPHAISTTNKSGLNFITIPEVFSGTTITLTCHERS